MESSCIVHNRKSLSKFHGIINQLRRTNEFNVSILQQLPRRCCSCHGQTGEILFTLDHLRQLCEQIQSSSQSPSLTKPPIKSLHYVILKYPSTYSILQRRHKIGRFIGRGGEHLQQLERSFNISIQILNDKTSKHLKKSMEDIQTKAKEDLLLLFTMNNNEDDIEKIKQSIENQWNQIDMLVKKTGRTKILQSVGSEIQSASSIEGDSRWKPKKRIPKSKLKLREKQMKEQENEEEVLPQPLVKPISMPQEIKTSRKKK